ncbi:general transcription factor 3C polypeptide 5 isoform X1 [Neodiprion fabricii]|uniref:general transcription factor 3C polypeptide 5 isoform X1 n=1 Tax=Neodiprion fabricii TaxID=2872261 RepID=UPI001ED9432A|nr:general transcription factor 3C polypeptide 5 isoform X1 [Neodiprion fabricii]
MSINGDDSDEERFEDDSDCNINASDYGEEGDSDDSIERSRARAAGRSQEYDGDEDDPNMKKYVGPVLPGGHRFDRKFICIKYPGNVINPEKAIETLGGLASISTAVDTHNRRLELRFRPDDGYRKPACGDRHLTTGFLLRIRVKKKQANDTQETKEPLQTNSRVMEVVNLGTTSQFVNTENVFSEALSKTLKTVVEKESELSRTEIEVKDLLKDLTNQVTTDCNVSVSCESKEIKKVDIREVKPDCSDQAECNESNDQFKSKKNCSLPFDKHKYKDLSRDDNYELPKLKVLGQVDTEFRFKNLCDFQFLPLTPSAVDRGENECIYDSIFPVGLPPYSWLKTKVPYFLPPAAFSRMDNVQLYVPKTGKDALSGSAIGKTRKRRGGFSNFVNFHTRDIPSEPPKGIENAMRVKFLQNYHLERVKKFFEQRPIWSKNALMYETKFTGEHLKVMLPSVAYYFISGPWRIMWVRLGYDPRKDPAARIYQTLDYRLKAMHGLESTVKCKRSYSNYILPYKLAPASKSKTTILSATIPEENRKKKEKHLRKNVYIYEEGTVPPSRQMFYQYCDVHVPEIQEMLEKLPNPSPETKCHEKMGWLPVGFDDHCREIINKQLRGVLRKRMNIPEDHPTTLPSRRGKLKFRRFKKQRAQKSHVVNSDSSSIHMKVLPDRSDEESEDRNNCSVPSTSQQDS